MIAASTSSMRTRSASTSPSARPTDHPRDHHAAAQDVHHAVRPRQIPLITSMDDILDLIQDVADRCAVRPRRVTP